MKLLDHRTARLIRAAQAACQSVNGTNPALCREQHEKDLAELAAALAGFDAPTSTLPAMTGEPWTEDEDRRLLASFDAGHGIQDIAEKHQRTQTGCRARLVKYGRLAS